MQKYQIAEQTAIELGIERLQDPAGLWVPNIIMQTWELGKRWGLPSTFSVGLNINGQDAYAPGPTEGRRWLVVSIRKPSTVGSSYVIVKPKDTSDAFVQVTADGTAAEVVSLGYPGWIIEHEDGGRYDGGKIGLKDSGNPGDTNRTLQALYYEVEM